MELEISGLKCDHCDYRDDTVTFDQYFTSINKKCPKCGANLLTQEEYDKCIKLQSFIKKLDKVGNVLKWINPIYYWRLIFGDKRKVKNVSITFYRED